MSEEKLEDLDIELYEYFILYENYLKFKMKENIDITLPPIPGDEEDGYTDPKLKEILSENREEESTVEKVEATTIQAIGREDITSVLYSEDNVNEGILVNILIPGYAATVVFKDEEEATDFFHKINAWRHGILPAQKG